MSKTIDKSKAVSELCKSIVENPFYNELKSNIYKQEIAFELGAYAPERRDAIELGVRKAMKWVFDYMENNAQFKEIENINNSEIF